MDTLEVRTYTKLFLAWLCFLDLVRKVLATRSSRVANELSLCVVFVLLETNELNVVLLHFYQ